MNRRTKGTIGLVGVIALAGAAVGARAVLPDKTARTPSTGDQPAATKSQEMPVVLTATRQMTFEQRVVLSGNVQAKNDALVSARIPGTVDSIFVDEGDSVVAGKTKLFQIDSLKVTKEVALARQGLLVGEAALREKRARMEQAVADKQQVERDAGRFQQLADQNAISLQQAEQYAARLQQAVAAVKDAQAMIELSEAQLEQARLSVAIAEKDLQDSLVLAPISGWVSERRSEPGEMAQTGVPVLKIEDLSVLEISVFLPEQYYHDVVPGRTKMRIQVGKTDLGTHAVSYRSPTVRSKLRTFEVRAVIKSPPPGVVPGRLAQVTVVLSSQQGLGVPSAAIQTRDGKPVVFTVEANKAKKIEVSTKGETDAWTEVVSAQLSAATPIITMGQDRVEDGVTVSVVKEPRE